jgi:antitoxin MazE
MAIIQKWGNSLGVRLPKAFVDQIGLHEGSEIELVLRNGTIVIAPSRPHYALHDLLAGCTPDRRPDAVEWGPDVGGEIL